MIPSHGSGASVRRKLKPRAPAQQAKAKKLQAYVDRWRYKAHTARQAQSRLKALAKLQPIDAVTDDPSVRELLQPGDPASILDLLERPDDRMGKSPLDARDRLLARSLDAAFSECRRLLGPDPSVWHWGALHAVHFLHATSAVRPEGGAVSDVGPLEMPGSDSTPLNAYYRASDFRVSLGASVRVVIDVGEWDNSICINAPGQSGNPASPYYSNLATAWSRGDFVPLLYSRSLVDDATVQLILCAPVDNTSVSDT